EAFDMGALQQAVLNLQAMAQHDKKDKKKDKKDKGKKSKKDKKKDKKKKKRRRSTSSDSSSSSRSRSRSGSSSSNSSSHNKALRWKDSGKSGMRVSARCTMCIDCSLLSSDLRSPEQGSCGQEWQLREASVASWAGQYTGLTEVRDLREVMTLANIMDSINRREMVQAMDVLSQRIVAIQLAKRKGGSWDKAELVELVPSGITARRAFSRLSETQGDPADFGGYLHTFLVAIESALASEKGGIPPSAGAVDLAEVLRQFAPEMSQQVLEPSSLLLKPADRPKRLKRGYFFLHVSYPKLVKKAVKAKLHRLVREDQVARHNGRRVQAGAFAVPKDGVENRVITDPEVNQLLDPVKLPRPRFAYVPRMRALTAPRGGKLLLSKRDARHYFHCLKIGKKWGRWLCGPPVRDNDGSPRFPAAQAAPMGFGPSAGWAQAVTDKIALGADLPHASRVHPGQIIPDELPVWGSIHVGDRGEADVGPVWMNRAEVAWEKDGVESNVKKKIDGQAGQEVQGYYVHATGHWIGTSHDKRRQLMQASIEILMSPKVLVGDVDRLEVYPWLTDARGNIVRVRALPDAVWLEIFWSTMLLPYSQFDISSPWTTRAECTDSSMTGLGRAWTTMPESVVRHMARLADCQGVYTNLDLPWGICLDSVGRCPLQRLRLPSMPLHWFEVSAPAAPDHIYLGEADAANWSVEDRLRRPGEVGVRFLQPMDSACVIGAFCKGRSASRRLNGKCRKHGAIVLAGKLEGFYPWVPSADNPADRPSRIYEPDKTPHHKAQPDTDDVFLQLPPGLADWAGTERVFLHFCSGPRRPGAKYPPPFCKALATCFVKNLGHGITKRNLNSPFEVPYQEALQTLNNDLEAMGMVLAYLPEEEQDWLLAEWILEGCENSKSRGGYGLALSALSKINPRVRFKVAWKVFDVWGKKAPPAQAPAAPPELITAMIVGGLEQKVVIANTSTVNWVLSYLAKFPGKKDDAARLFSLSYGSVLRWVKKLSGLFGVMDVPLSTYSFRRSGASELSRLGVPLADILAYGRWLSERAARAYIRKGDVAIIRARLIFSPQLQFVSDKWCALATVAWQLVPSLKAALADVPIHRVTEQVFQQFQNLVLNL
ncbi:unnamed protein product, partial [Polarella glacialis]